MFGSRRPAILIFWEGKSGRDSVIAFKSFLDLIGGNRAFPADTPVIPTKLDNQYFSLVQSGPLWDALAQARALSVFVPSEIADPKMELLVVLS